MMDIEFECGRTAKNVGELKMALNAHLEICDNTLCVEDVKESIKNYC